MATSERLLHAIFMEIRRSSTHANGDHPEKTEAINEWILVAMVLDRIFLFVFLTVAMVTSLAILLNRP